MTKIATESHLNGILASQTPSFSIIYKDLLTRLALPIELYQVYKRTTPGLKKIYRFPCSVLSGARLQMQHSE